MSAFDIAVETLLGEWEPKIGRPTCGPGCSRCCERTTILLSSAEALRIHDAIGDDPRWQERARRLRTLELSDPIAAQNALIDLGPCVFLDEAKRCGIYEARPDACRAFHVWHPAEYCGREDYDMCTPAELNALRVDRIHTLMLAELDQGRRPFWGQLLPMVAVLGEHQQRYRDGEDLSSFVEPRWIETELIEFPAPGEDRAAICKDLETEQARLKKLFIEEENPMGFPRGAAAPDRAFLAAFPLD